MSKTMAVMEARPRLSGDVESLLAQFRARIRQYVWLQGLAATVAALCAAAWLCLGIDWLLEPPRAVRWLLLSASVAAAGWVAYQFIVRRIVVPLSDANLALLLERRYRGFDDALLTAVSLTRSDRELGELTREMLATTCHEAAHRARAVQLGEVFDRRPLGRATAIAGALVLSLVTLVAAAPQTVRFAAQRLIGATDEPWPRKTRLLVAGFDNGAKVIAKGDDLQLLVQADTAWEVVPELVQVRYRTEEGMRGRENMSREGHAVPGEDPFQNFRHTFPSVLSSFSFDVLGGDARLRDLRVQVVESPTVVETVLWCEYPAYMRRASRELPVTGSMQVPLGTRITVRARANKDLLRAQIDYPLDAESFHTETLTLPGADGDPRRFEFALPNFDADKSLSITLFDTDGIHNRKPFVVALSAVVDEPPQISVQLQGIGAAITPQARLPLAGRILDDYGVSSAAFAYAIDAEPPRDAPLAVDPAGRSEVAIDEAFEVRELELKPGQKLLFGATASDAFHLVDGDRPHVAASERFQLDVVTPEALRSLLESRELNLRQRFETIIGEVTESRDAIAQIAPARGTEAPAAEGEGSQPEAGAGDLATAEIRVQRALQNSEKNAQETLGVAASFDDIRAELINNRVDTEELKVRLKDYIADPLRGIAAEMFPELDRRLRTLQEKLADPGGGAEARQASLAQADAILVALAQVRDKMLELESFNEAIELLRSIMSAEQALLEQTKKRQKDKVRDLLEDAK